MHSVTTRAASSREGQQSVSLVFNSFSKNDSSLELALPIAIALQAQNCPVGSILHMSELVSIRARDC